MRELSALSVSFTSRAPNNRRAEAQRPKLLVGDILPCVPPAGLFSFFFLELDAENGNIRDVFFFFSLLEIDWGTGKD